MTPTRSAGRLRAGLAAVAVLTALMAVPAGASVDTRARAAEARRAGAIAECSLPAQLRRAAGPGPRSGCLRAVLTAGSAGGQPTGATGPSELPVCLDQVASVNSRCETWSRSFNVPSPDGSVASDAPAGAVVNRRGDRMFVATTSRVGAAADRLTVAALSTGGKGATAWIAHPPTPQPTTAAALTLTPDESAVIVAGTITYLPNLNAAPLVFWLTSAYATSNGRFLWSATYRLGGTYNAPISIRPSPRGDKFFVTGYSVYPNTRAYVEWVTVAYSARGKQLWLQRYGGVAGGQNVPVGLAVSPRGDTVYVGGTSEHPQTTGQFSWDYAVIAYDARSGRPRWKTITRTGSNQIPVALALTPGGDRVVLTGTATFGTATSPVTGILTVGHATGNGARLWSTRYADPSGLSATATTLSISPRGDRVYVGAAVGQRRVVVEGAIEPSALAITVFALSSVNGRQAWRASYTPEPSYSAVPVVATVNPVTGSVYLAGLLGPAGALAAYPVTLAVTSAGATAWVARYDLRDPGSLGVSALGYPADPVEIIADRAGKTVYTSLAYYPVSAGAASAECAQAHANGINQDCRPTGPADLILAYVR